MKKLTKLVYILATLSILGLVSSCKSSESYSVGDPEETGFFGFYFPAQDNLNSLQTYDPSWDRTATFTVARTNTDGAVTVPITITGENGSGDPSVFSIENAVFEDGQTETEVTLSFPNAEIGVEYKITLYVPEYLNSSKYQDENHPLSADFSVLIVTWIELTNPDATDASGLWTFYETWWGEVHTAKIQYYELEGVRYCRTYDEALVSGADSDGGGIWGTGEDIHLEFVWYTKNQTDDGYDYVQVPKQYMGWDYQGVSPVYAYDWFDYFAEEQSYSKDFFTFYANNGASYPPCYYDGNGGFFFNMRYYVPGVGGWSPDQYELYTIGSDYSRPDYSIELSSSLTENAVTPIDVTVGNEVGYVTYDIYEGSLTETQVSNAVSAILAGDYEESIKVENSEFTIETQMDSTGTYTIVALSYDEDGEYQGFYDYEVFTYVADGDPVPVSITAGLNEIQDAYKQQGYSSDNTLQLYIFSEDQNITALKFGLYTAATYVGDEENCLADVKENGYSLVDSTLALVNGEGYVDLMTGLMPGTEYYILVYATNGYEEDTFAFGTAWTTGDPLPIYQTYTYEDVVSDLLDATGESYVGTYNLYAVNLWGSSTLRDYVGQASIDFLDESTYGSRTDGYGVAMQVKGLSGDPDYTETYVTAYGYDDCVYLDNYQGYLYIAEAATADGTFTLYSYSKNLGKSYKVTYSVCMIPVAEGYYAFLDDGYYYSDYNFCGLLFYNSGTYCAMSDYLLVEPEVDDNGVAPAAVKARAKAAKKAMRDMKIAYGSFNENPEAHIKAINKAMNDAIYPEGTLAKGVKIVEGAVVRNTELKKAGVASSNVVKRETGRNATIRKTVDKPVI